jgi:hypothetical protein
VQDVWRARLRQEEEQEHPTDARKPHELPDGPFPAFSLNSEATDKRTEYRSAAVSSISTFVFYAHSPMFTYTAPIPQTARPYTCFLGRYMSAIEAPPVASAGDPKNPVKNRKARSMPKLMEKTVGNCRRTKMTDWHSC